MAATTTNYFALLIGGLVAFRLALLFSKESGPGFIFRKLRRLPPPKSSTKEGLACPWCLSVWFAAMIACYEFWLGWILAAEIPLYWLGISAIGVICNQQWTKE